MRLHDLRHSSGAVYWLRARTLRRSNTRWATAARWCAKYTHKPKGGEGSRTASAGMWAEVMASGTGGSIHDQAVAEGD